MAAVAMAVDMTAAAAEMDDRRLPIEAWLDVQGVTQEKEKANCKDLREQELRGCGPR